MFNYEGPMLWLVSVYHDQTVTTDSLLTVIDREVDALATTPVDSATLARAKVKMRSSLYDIVDEFSGIGKLDLLASFALFDNDPNRFNTLEAEFAKVTPQLIQSTAQEYLRRGNRTVYTVRAGAGSSTTAGGR
jgi:predicted Zn-dependent peptidase